MAKLGLMGNRNSGRRPQPTALKVLRGNPGQRKLNAAEPLPPSGDVAAPTHLSPSARAVWERLAPIAIAMGTLTTADVTTFGTLCELQSTLEMASAHKAVDGFMPFGLSDDGGGATVHAALRLERETANALRPYYEKFGLEPAGRSRISVPKPKEPENKWAGLLA